MNIEDTSALELLMGSGYKFIVVEDSGHIASKHRTEKSAVANASLHEKAGRGSRVMAVLDLLVPATLRETYDNKIAQLERDVEDLKALVTSLVTNADR